MQLLSVTILQFIYIFIALNIGIPGVYKENFLQNKIILFIGFFLFQLLVNSVSKIQSKCKTKISNIMNDSFFVALLSVIGYSIFLDLSMMKNTNAIIAPYLENSHLTHLLLSGIITSFIFTTKVLQIIFLGNETCNNIDNHFELSY